MGDDQFRLGRLTSLLIPFALSFASLAGCGRPQVDQMRFQEKVERPYASRPFANPDDRQSSPEEIPETRPEILNYKAPVVGLWDQKSQQGRVWSSMTAQLLIEKGQLLLKSNPSDAQFFCPRFSASMSLENRVAFYVALISAMAANESSFDPEAKHQENFRDRTGQFVVSRGLMQMSFESVRPYCKVQRAEDLHDPRKNLECAVSYMNKMISKHGIIAGGQKGAWRGASTYWAVMQSPKTRQKIRAAVARTPVCQPQ